MKHVAILVSLLVVVVSLTLPHTAESQRPDSAREVRRLIGKSMRYIEMHLGAPEGVRSQRLPVSGDREELWLYPSRGIAVIFRDGRSTRVDVEDFAALRIPPQLPVADPYPVPTRQELERDAQEREAIRQALDASARRDLRVLVAMAEGAIERARRAPSPDETTSAVESFRTKLRAFRDAHAEWIRDPANGTGAVDNLERVATAINTAAAAWARGLKLEQYLPQAEAQLLKAQGAEAASRAKGVAAAREEHAAAVRFREDQVQRAERAVREAAEALAKP